MFSDNIKTRLMERFNAPLPDFRKRHIVFWHDENAEFADIVSDLALPGVTVIKLTNSNNFAVKKLLTVDGLSGNHLV